MDTTDNIIIVQHNVRNWNSHKLTLTNLYKELNPDVILINSHGLKSTQNIKIYTYQTYLINSSDEQHDGSAVLIKQHLKHKIKDNYDTDILLITIYTNTGPINIATTYLPPRRPYLPITDFHRLASESHPTYIIGDLNAHHPNIDRRRSNNVGNAIQMLIDRNKLVHIGPNFPTFYSHNSNSTPDIILTNNNTYHNINITQGPTTPSDHLPIIIKLTAQATHTVTTPVYNTNKANWDKFKTQIERTNSNINTNQNMTQNALDENIGIWMNNIKSAMDENIPKLKHKTTAKSIYNKKIKKLQFWANNLLKNSLTQGWTYTKYKIYKKIQQCIIKECKEQNIKNWENKLQNLNKLYADPKNFWQNIKILRGNQTNTKPYLLVDNNKIYSTEEKERIFRDIWKNVFKISPIENSQFDMANEIRVNNHLNNIKEQITPYQQGNPDNLNTDNYFTATITLQEIKDIIKQLKNNAPGTSKVNKAIMQQLPEQALITYTELLNITLSMGYFPLPFKHAKVILIPKPDKPTTDPINYRPISLLEVPGKIFEKIINKRTRTFLEINRILPETQHGFRAARSTDTALALTTETIAKNLAEGKQCCIALRDVSKAFDKVWHEGLQFKINQINLPIILQKILNSFLTNRTASIALNDHTGPPFHIHSGVPQGSSISPTLYTIYTHDVPPPISDSINIQYADDITQIITYAGKSKKMLSRKIEKEIININTYEKLWKIQTNTQKFTLLPLAIKKTEPVTIDGNIIPYKQEAKVLGLKISNTGYNKHVKDTINKSMLALNTIKKFSKLNTKIKLHLVKACVTPILTYPAYVLNALATTQILKLQRTQNKALRFVYNERYPYTNNTKDLHTLAKMEPINKTIHHRGNTIKHKITHIIKDTNYTLAINDHNLNRDHIWFRRPVTNLSNNPPAALFT